MCAIPFATVDHLPECPAWVKDSKPIKVTDNLDPCQLGQAVNRGGGGYVCFARCNQGIWAEINPMDPERTNQSDCWNIDRVHGH